ncbi:helix-turn-helix domain-containing protein [Nonomuraea sp. NPDC049646]|uniref:helix-turn-helix domain-containing protein n=1 Tax=unclassified Nonomuraea TaxID=2593643 RepID=UPI00378DC4E1
MAGRPFTRGSRGRPAVLGRRARLSRAAFSRRFTQFVGRPPLSYLTWWRLSTAARMLRDSDAALSTVAAAVGYGSEFAFANAFGFSRWPPAGGRRGRSGDGGRPGRRGGWRSARRCAAR